MKFCKECGNILFPTEDDDKLVGVCKNGCKNEDEYDNKIIKSTVYKRAATENNANKAFYIYDKTLPYTKQVECPNLDCPSKKDKGLQEAVFYQDENSMKTNYVCTACNATWKYG